MVVFILCSLFFYHIIMSNIVAIVGRPNVGKSTLYNRLTETRKAIVDDFSGVTRDRHYGVAEWTDKHFTVIDTGGYVAHSDDVFEAAIREQVVIAIEEATVILFMVDVVTGVTDLDDDIAKLLRRSTKPVFVVVNKVDNNQRITDASVFTASDWVKFTRFLPCRVQVPVNFLTK